MKYFLKVSCSTKDVAFLLVLSNSVHYSIVLATSTAFDAVRLFAILQHLRYTKNLFAITIVFPTNMKAVV